MEDVEKHAMLLKQVALSTKIDNPCFIDGIFESYNIYRGQTALTANMSPDDGVMETEKRAFDCS